MATGGSSKAIVAALLANMGIAIAKFVGFLVTRSASMLAESVHSVADSGNQGLLLIGGRRAARRATPEHPFGYGRERYFYSFVVALVLFTLGAAFATYEGIEKIRHPHELSSPGWAIGILAVGIVLEALSFRIAVREARHVKGEAGWWAYIRRSRSPELPVVLLEDLGALIGLVLAIVAVSIASVTDNARWDGIGTLSIGVLLAVIAVVLAFEMKSLLIGESATRTDIDAIRRTIGADPSVDRLVHMRTQHLGPEELLVGAKIEFDPGLDTSALATTVDRVEAAIRAEVPIARIIYLEPALFDADRDPAGAEIAAGLAGGGDGDGGGVVPGHQ